MSHWGLGEGNLTHPGGFPLPRPGFLDPPGALPALPTAPPGGGGGGPTGGSVAINLPPEGCGSYVFKKHCGVYRWVKKSRRRRRRLATVADIRDLVALKGVFGNGQGFNTWIATHGN